MHLKKLTVRYLLIENYTYIQIYTYQVLKNFRNKLKKMVFILIFRKLKKYTYYYIVLYVFYVNFNANAIIFSFKCILVYFILYFNFNYVL